MATPNAARLADIILKRAEPIARTTEQVEILVDRQGADRHGWQLALQRLRNAEARLLTLENTPDLGGRRKMNTPGLIEKARTEVEQLREEADKLRAKVRDCFVIVTVRNLSEEETHEAQAKHDTSKDIENAILARSIVSITDHEGDPLADMGYDEAYGFVEWLRGDALSFQLLRNAVDAAGVGVDFPS